MTSPLELQQKKIRLRLRSAQQRRDLAQDAAALLPAFTAAENLRHGWRWVREHPALLASAAAALLIARPRIVLRWARRGWIAWAAWRRLNGLGKQRHALSLIGLLSTLLSK